MDFFAIFRGFSGHRENPGKIEKKSFFILDSANFDDSSKIAESSVRMAFFAIFRGYVQGYTGYKVIRSGLY